MLNILGNWPLAVMIVCMAFAAGAIMWWLVGSTKVVLLKSVQFL
jgi:hypothetical protein